MIKSTYDYRFLLKNKCVNLLYEYNNNLSIDVTRKLIKKKKKNDYQASQKKQKKLNCVIAKKRYTLIENNN